MAAAVSSGAFASGAPCDVPALCGQSDRLGRPQQRPADGVLYDRLHHFIAAGIWDEAQLQQALLGEADRLVGGYNAILVVDDTTLPKKGNRSIEVAPQYATTLSKAANCQTLVSLTLARGEVPIAVGLALFPPDTWTGDTDQMATAGVPEDRRTARAKLKIAIAEIDRVREGGVRFGYVLADAGYGCSAPFRQALSERGLRWAFGIAGRNKVYPADVAMIFAVAGRERPLQHYVLDQVSVAAETILADRPPGELAARYQGTDVGSLLCVVCPNG